MNVGQLKKLLKGVDDDVEVINQISMEQGRGSSGGIDYQPNIDLYEVGEGEHWLMDECCDDVPSLWDVDEHGDSVNTRRVLIIGGSCDEDWYQ